MVIFLAQSKLCTEVLGDLRQKTHQPSVILNEVKDLLFKQKQILRYRSE